MLNLDRAAVLDFLREIDQPWREDHTNADVSRTRARLRRDVLPALHDLQPQAARRATQLAGHLREVMQVFDATVDHLAEQSVTLGSDGGIVIDRSTVADVYPVMLHELLRRVLLAIDLPADTLSGRALQPIVTAITDGAGGKRRFELAGGVIVEVTRKEVTIGATDD
jgi:tRNA(Ile)-lysidine synthase